MFDGSGEGEDYGGGFCSPSPPSTQPQSPSLSPPMSPSSPNSRRSTTPEVPREQPPLPHVPLTPTPLDHPGVTPLPDIDNQAFCPPSAWNEAPAVRYAYLKAALGSVLGHLTIPAATDHLNTALNALRLADALPSNTATTLITAKKRLGLDPDAFIKAILICSICFANYTHEEISKLMSPECTWAKCNGIVYKEKRTADRKTKRSPAKILPHAPLTNQLRRFFMCPGFAELLHDSSQCVDHSDDDTYKMTDIYNGALWTKGTLGLRHVAICGKVVNKILFPESRRSFHTTPFALRLTMNMDW
jgi:hypothetical protein